MEELKKIKIIPMMTLFIITFIVAKTSILFCTFF